jgi:methylated-DNA-[protein]-cysteine S-methyltransferase
MRAPGQRYELRETALGWIGVTATERGLRMSTLPAATRAEAARRLQVDDAVANGSEVTAAACDRLEAYARGDKVGFDDMPLDPQGTGFQLGVWLQLRRIPRGQTRSYGWVADELGLGPGSARAVGAANGQNPLPIILPCHRVIGADGDLRGFAGGLDMKERLLVLEGALPARFETVAPSRSPRRRPSGHFAGRAAMAPPDRTAAGIAAQAPLPLG